MERRTRQREAIWQVIERAARPLGPQEILDLAKEEVPRLGIATVYRNIKALIGEGRLRVVELPGRSDRYEVAGKEHHHHFHCRRCDGVFEVETCPGDFETLTPTGFRLEEHEVTLYGLCVSCNSREVTLVTNG
jgi:Fur family ferric uptake transcriptional regulator